MRRAAVQTSAGCGRLQGQELTETASADPGYGMFLRTLLYTDGGPRQPGAGGVRVRPAERERHGDRLARQLPGVTDTNVRREPNELADRLVNDALDVV